MNGQLSIRQDAFICFLSSWVPTDLITQLWLLVEVIVITDFNHWRIPLGRMKKLNPFRDGSGIVAMLVVMLSDFSWYELSGVYMLGEQVELTFDIDESSTIMRISAFFQCGFQILKKKNFILFFL
jgi:hypothetical protein